MQALRHFTLRRLLPALLAAAAIGIAAAGARTPAADQGDRLKASYIFMEGVAAMNDSRYDDALLLFNRAAELDPADRDIAAVRGELIFMTLAGDSAEYADAYRAIRERFIADPNETNGMFVVRTGSKLYGQGDERMVYRLLSRRYPARTDFALRYARALALASQNGESAALDSALRIYDTLEAGLGPDQSIITQRISALAIHRDSAAIAEQLHKLYAAAPADPETNLLVGMHFFSIGARDSSIFYLNRAVELDSTNGDAVLTRAEYFREVGDSARYDTEVFRALESPGLEFAPKLSLLTEYVRSLYDDPAHAAAINRLFRVMEDIHPGEAELHNLYGAYLATVDSTAAAAEQFGYAVDLDPEQEQNWVYLMQTAAAAKDDARAIDAGRRAMRRFPDNLLFPLMAASLIYKDQGPQAALALVDSIDTSDFNNPAALSMVHSSRGDYLYAMQMTDSAFSEYDRAVRLDPTNHSAMNNAAYHMAETDRDLGRASALINAALHEQPTNPTYIDTYAWVLFKQGNYEEARHQIDIVLDMTADSLDYSRGGVIIEADTAAVEVPSAIEEEVEEVIEDVEGDPYEPSAEIYEHAGDIYFKCGEREQAVEFWRRALLLDPESKTLPAKIKRKSL